MTWESRLLSKAVLVEKFEISKWKISPTTEPVSKVGRILLNVIGTS
jgi:hypothetical protein